MAKGIFIWVHKVYTDKAGNTNLSTRKVVEQFPVDHDFGFDIFDPYQWRIYLRNYITPKGKPLPVRSKQGDKIVYSVYIIGMTEQMKMYVFEKDGGYAKGFYYMLFPGYAETQPKRKLKDIVKYGDISR